MAANAGRDLEQKEKSEEIEGIDWEKDPGTGYTARDRSFRLPEFEALPEEWIVTPQAKELYKRSGPKQGMVLIAAKQWSEEKNQEVVNIYLFPAYNAYNILAMKWNELPNNRPNTIYIQCESYGLKYQFSDEKGQPKKDAAGLIPWRELGVDDSQVKEYTEAKIIKDYAETFISRISTIAAEAGQANRHGPRPIVDRFGKPFEFNEHVYSPEPLGRNSGWVHSEAMRRAFGPVGDWAKQGIKVGVVFGMGIWKGEEGHLLSQVRNKSASLNDGLTGGSVLYNPMLHHALYFDSMLSRLEEYDEEYSLRRTLPAELTLKVVQALVNQLECPPDTRKDSFEWVGMEQKTCRSEAEKWWAENHDNPREINNKLVNTLCIAIRRNRNITVVQKALACIFINLDKLVMEGVDIEYGIKKLLREYLAKPLEEAEEKSNPDILELLKSAEANYLKRKIPSLVIGLADQLQKKKINLDLTTEGWSILIEAAVEHPEQLEQSIEAYAQLSSMNRRERGQQGSQPLPKEAKKAESKEDDEPEVINVKLADNIYRHIFKNPDVAEVKELLESIFINLDKLMMHGVYSVFEITNLLRDCLELPIKAATQRKHAALELLNQAESNYLKRKVPSAVKRLEALASEKKIVVRYALLCANLLVEVAVDYPDRLEKSLEAFAQLRSIKMDDTEAMNNIVTEAYQKPELIAEACSIIREAKPKAKKFLISFLKSLQHAELISKLKKLNLQEDDALLYELNRNDLSVAKCDLLINLFTKLKMSFPNLISLQLIVKAESIIKKYSPFASIRMVDETGWQLILDSPEKADEIAARIYQEQTQPLKEPPCSHYSGSNAIAATLEHWAAQAYCNIKLLVNKIVLSYSDQLEKIHAVCRIIEKYRLQKIISAVFGSQDHLDKLLQLERAGLLREDMPRRNKKFAAKLFAMNDPLRAELFLDVAKRLNQEQKQEGLIDDTEHIISRYSRFKTTAAMRFNFGMVAQDVCDKIMEHPEKETVFRQAEERLQDCEYKDVAVLRKQVLASPGDVYDLIYAYRKLDEAKLDKDEKLCALVLELPKHARELVDLCTRIQKKYNSKKSMAEYKEFAIIANACAVLKNLTLHSKDFDDQINKFFQSVQHMGVVIKLKELGLIDKSPFVLEVCARLNDYLNPDDVESVDAEIKDTEQWLNVIVKLTNSVAPANAPVSHDVVIQKARVLMDRYGEYGNKKRIDAKDDADVSRRILENPDQEQEIFAEFYQRQMQDVEKQLRAIHPGSEHEQSVTDLMKVMRECQLDYRISRKLLQEYQEHAKVFYDVCVLVKKYDLMAEAVEFVFSSLENMQKLISYDGNADQAAKLLSLNRRILAFIALPNKYRGVNLAEMLVTDLEQCETRCKILDMKLEAKEERDLLHMCRWSPKEFSRDVAKLEQAKLLGNPAVRQLILVEARQTKNHPGFYLRPSEQSVQHGFDVDVYVDKLISICLKIEKLTIEKDKKTELIQRLASGKEIDAVVLIIEKFGQAGFLGTPRAADRP